MTAQWSNGAQRGRGTARTAQGKAEPPCEICKAKAGDECHNTIRPGEPLPGRSEHYARRER
jgi:hypothetical protein